jgi:hypothetical protein
MLKSGELCIVSNNTHCFLDDFGLQQITKKEIVIVIRDSSDNWLVNVITKFGIAEINKEKIVPYIG